MFDMWGKFARGNRPLLHMTITKEQPKPALGHFFVCPAKAVKFNETKTKKPFVESQIALAISK